MDRFAPVITKNVYTFNSLTPLPGERPYSVLSISYDNFLTLLNNPNKSNFLNQYLEINIYDETIITSQDDYILRSRLLRFLNDLNIKNIKFNLSDNMMSTYNEIMHRIGWKHQNNTTLSITIDRHPTDRKDLNLLIAQGKLDIPEEKLICVPSTIIHGLQGRVDEQVLQKAIALQKRVMEYANRLKALYHTEEFTEFDKVWLAYDFIKRHISYAWEASRSVDGRQAFYNPNHANDWASEPLGTLEHHKGVCVGQARLMQALLTNPYMKTNTVVISGELPNAPHAWVGSVIDDRLYQTCLTLSKPLQDLRQYGYVPDEGEIYPRIYETASLSRNEILQIQNHIQSLKKS